MLVQS